MKETLLTIRLLALLNIRHVSLIVNKPFLETIMPTIFHKGRKVLRQEIGNHNYAEIADLLYFRITGSKYYNKEGKPFFLLPNLNHIAEETGFGKTLCKKALSALEKNNWIKRVKIKCFDGAVRIKIFITDKFQDIMLFIDSMHTADNSQPNEKKTEEASVCADKAQSDQSEKARSDQSYIKEKTTKEENNKYNHVQDYKATENDSPNLVKPVNFVFSLDLDKHTDAAETFVKETAEKENLSPDDLLLTLSELQESGLYQTQETMIDDAIKSLKRIEGQADVLPEGDIKLKPKKAIFRAEDTRIPHLSPLQQVAVMQTLKELYIKKKAKIGSIIETFAWVEFQVTNPEHHFQGKGFRHCLNIIKKMLCHNGKRQYSKPYGYGEVFKLAPDA